ncbi:MAG: PspC domain-containing protein [Chloroflexota bacterium]
MEKRLYRSRTDRMIWGVCGGIADYFGIDPTIVRVLAVLLTLASGGAGFVIYVVMAVVVPLESSPSREPRDVIRENVEEIKQTATNLGEEMRSTFARHEGEVREMSRTGMRHGGYFIAVILIVIGVLFLLSNFNFFWWFRWRYLWPVILIAIGLVIIFGHRRR